ncbi:Fic family protein [Microbacterium sp. 77mftsu3.1]|uniref:Fic family protein n=1 Tax=Microbacterium sp. 77mftsu3.1 TaxID=1761802 RepID=UPI000378E073|nr:Fic family protein [Microbacterium sp. 77mftsu3.1]SDH50307.1 Fic/DOC family protein [Microbacterium sp. 77mftsu3.1]
MADVIPRRPTLLERVERIPTAVVPPLAGQPLPPVTFPLDGVDVPVLSFGAILVDAVTSSAIESIRASVTQATLAFWQPRHPLVTPAGRAVAANIRAITDARFGRATYGDHRLAHTRLMRGQGTASYGGGYRQVNVRISDHVAPAPPRISALMNDLVEFVHSHRTTVLTAAIAHAQFESIHPYPDGNGRIGRALLSGHLGLPISPFLLRHRQSYYDALRDIRLGDAGPIVDLVAGAAAAGWDIAEETGDYWSAHEHLLDGIPVYTTAAGRAYNVPIGTRARILRSNAKRLHAEFDELIAGGTIIAVSENLGTDTVYGYVPILSTWLRITEDGTLGTQYEGKWKDDLRV